MSRYDYDRDEEDYGGGGRGLGGRASGDEVVRGPGPRELDTHLELLVALGKLLNEL